MEQMGIDLFERGMEWMEIKALKARVVTLYAFLSIVNHVQTPSLKETQSMRLIPSAINLSLWARNEEGNNADGPIPNKKQQKAMTLNDACM